MRGRTISRFDAGVFLLARYALSKPRVLLAPRILCAVAHGR